MPHADENDRRRSLNPLTLIRQFAVTYWETVRGPRDPQDEQDSWTWTA